MTPDQMAKLAARLREHAHLHRTYLPQDNEQKQWTADLDRAADLIAGMAQRVPLSDEQVRTLVQTMDWPSSVTEIVRAVEQAHGIRSEK